MAAPLVDSSNDNLRDLELLIRSHNPIICLETIEIERADSLLNYLADQMHLPFFSWTPTKGLKRSDQPGKVYGSSDVVQALSYIESADIEAIFSFHQLARYMERPLVVDKIQDVAEKLKRHRGTLVMIEQDPDLPPIVSRHVHTIRLSYPTKREYEMLLKSIIRDCSDRMKVEMKLTDGQMGTLLGNLRGLTLLEAEKALTNAVIASKTLSADSITKILEAKRKIIERDGVLEYYPAKESWAEVAGLNRLKEWLRKRKQIFLQPERAAEFGLEFPKGILLLGVQGCGKSLCAKVVAGEWSMPLLKLDPSNLYNKYIGESEKNLKKAIKTAEAMAPLVLWIDELEKALGSAGEADEDGGVSKRILGTLLSWLQEKDEAVFVIATSNDVTKLPPELLRKGRFDEIFFVDLPDSECRKEIFRVHLSRKKQDACKYDLNQLSKAAAGFSGAEIEQAVISALYTTFSSGEPMSTKVILEEISKTNPISRTMSEKIGRLRTWAKGRTVFAD